MSTPPLRAFFLLSILFAVLSYSMDFVRKTYVLHAYIPFVSSKFQLAKYYVETGQIESAISEYKIALDTSTPLVQAQANQELAQLINLQNDSWRIFETNIVYLLWILSPKFILLSILFLLLYILFLFFTLFGKHHTLLILPIKDFSSLNLGDLLPELAIDRLKSLNWQLKKIRNNPSVLYEAVDVPIMAMISEKDLLDVTHFVETALMISGDFWKGFPLSHTINLIKLWFEQPKYLLQGSLIHGPDNSIHLNLVLLSGKNRTIEKVWDVRISCQDNALLVREIVDSLIFPVLFHFATNLTAKRWEVLKEFQCGIDQLLIYDESNSDITFLINAQSFFEKALNIDPNYDFAKNNLALLLLEIGDVGTSRDIFREISESSSNLSMKEYATYGYTVTLIMENQEWALKRAIDVLKDLIAKSNNQELVLLATSALAITYAQMAEKGNDKESYTKLALSESKAIRQAGLAPQPVLANAMIAEAYSFLALGKIQDSIKNFEEAINIHHGNIFGLIGLGIAYIKDNQVENALTVLKKAEAVAPSNHYASFKLGNIYRDLGKKESAIKAYKRANGFPLSHLMLGKLSLEDKELDDALTEFNKAVALNKRLGDGWVNIAWTICEMDPERTASLLDDAEAAARRALQLEKNEKYIWHRQAILSRILLLRGKHILALQAAKKAVEYAPEKAQANYYLAKAEYESGHQEIAARLARHVIELDKQGEWRIKSEEFLENIGQVWEDNKSS